VAPSPSFTPALASPVEGEGKDGQARSLKTAGSWRIVLGIRPCREVCYDSGSRSIARQITLGV